MPLDPASERAVAQKVEGADLDPGVLPDPDVADVLVVDPRLDHQAAAGRHQLHDRLVGADRLTWRGHGQLLHDAVDRGAHHHVAQQGLGAAARLCQAVALGLGRGKLG